MKDVGEIRTDTALPANSPVNGVCLAQFFFAAPLDLRKKNKSSTTYLILGPPPPPSKVNTSPISAIRYEKGGDNFPGVWTCHSLVSAYCIRSVAVFVLVRTLHNGYLGSWVVLIITHNPYPPSLTPPMLAAQAGMR